MHREEIAVEDIDVAVIGAGQAGLATSRELSERDVDHVVLEQQRPGFAWSQRWDSFTLVTPNHSIRLPGGPYAGDDPHGYLTREGIEEHISTYAAGLAAEVRSGVRVDRLRPADAGGFVLDTDGGPIRANAVVVATGAYQRPHRPPAVLSIQERLEVLDSIDYRRPSMLPDGSVLVVGGGQSACQIAEELLLAGRDVVMACGRAPWFYRRPGGRDLFDWLIDVGLLDEGPDALPTPAARLGANIQATGARGGHDLSYRTLAALGARLGGHLVVEADGTPSLAPDLEATLAFCDQVHGLIRTTLLDWSVQPGRPHLDIPPPPAFQPEPVHRLDLRAFGAVIVAAGFRTRYTEWIDVPGIVDDFGFPVHDDGESTVAPGLHFVGVHLLRKRMSSLLLGVGEDAARTADRIAASPRVSAA
jgi:putative flavoprotein involved in K+ transport